MSLKQSIAGKQAKAHGKGFEKFIESAAGIAGFNVTRMPDGMVSRGLNKMQRIKTYYDFILLKPDDKIIFLDCKTTNNKTFSHSSLTQHQVIKLKEIHDLGYAAGYVIEYRPLNEIVWFPASTLKFLKPGQSLRPSDGLALGNRFRIVFDFIFGG